MKKLFRFYWLLCLPLLFLSCDKSKQTGISATNTNAVLFEEEDKDIATILSEKELKKGVIRFYNREYQAAIQLFTKALSLDPMNTKARYYLGYAYLNSGYAKNAIDEWENLISLGGGNYQVKQKLNDLYFQLVIDKNYEYSTPYVFSKLFDGISDGMHKIIRPSFIYYNSKTDSFLVSTAKTKYVVEVDGNRNIVRQIGRKFGDFSVFQMPTGIAIYNDLIYVADFKADKIFVFQPDGKVMKQIGMKGYQSSNLSGPMGIYISEDEYLFVVDNGNNRVQKFDLDGVWIQSIGENELDRPTDIIGQGEYIFVSDTHHGRVLQYDRFGNLVQEIGKDQLREPRGLTIGRNKLFIVDSKQGIFVYDLENSGMEKLGVDEGRLALPFDICMDGNELLYETDFNTQNIAIYIPLQLRYANLGVSIPQIWLTSYPNVMLHFRVWDKKGNPITDLKEENVIITEEGENIPFVRLGATSKFRDKMSIQFVIDKSMGMESFAPELEESMKAFLEKMTGDDWIDITLTGQETKRSGKVAANVLWSLDYVKRQPFEGDYPADLGQALYDATSRLLNINRNKAIVLFTSGDIGATSFTNYDEQIIETYARENAIPIYVVSYTENNKEVFSRIAEKTFGKYYSINQMKNIFALQDEIKNARPLEYIASYEGLNLKGLNDFWVNVHLKIRYKSLVGVDDTGYFVPDMVSEGAFGAKTEINLEKDFKDKNE